MPSGLTVKRWCEFGNSGAEALQAIRNRLPAASPESLAQLEITRDADGELRTGTPNDLSQALAQSLVVMEGLDTHAVDV